MINISYYYEYYWIDKRQYLPFKVKLDGKDLDNVNSFVYLGAEITGDGDHSITMKHRCNIAIGRFGEYRTVLTTTRLPQRLKLCLYGTSCLLWHMNHVHGVL